jgi:hypothetical protein
LSIPLCANFSRLDKVRDNESKRGLSWRPSGQVFCAYFGFAIGVQPNFAAQCGFSIPAAPVVAFFAGAVVYALLSKMQTQVLPYPQARQQSAD